MGSSRLRFSSHTPLDRIVAPEPARAPVHKKTPAHGGKPQVVRLIGGQWKRSKLPVIDAPGLRPTPDRVRETLFNWLGQSLDGWRCLDAFAGTGALGFEAASRGAEDVVLLERDARLAQALQATHQRLKAGPGVRVEPADALAWMARCSPSRYELVFIDPPFDADVFAAAVRVASRVVVTGGFVYLEADRAFTAADFDGGEPLALYRHGRAGAVHYHLFQRVEPGYTDPQAGAAAAGPVGQP
jgi:16S rRNA (guanine966-N2)-methyltransferase